MSIFLTFNKGYVFRFFTKLKNATRCKHFTWPLPAARPRIRRRWQHCTTCHALRRVALCSQQHASKCGAHALERCVAIRCWPMMARSAQLVCLHHAAWLLSHSAATSRRGDTYCIMIDDAWWLCCSCKLTFQMSRIFVYLDVVALMFCASTMSPHMLKSSRENTAVLTCCGKPTGIPGLTLVRATRWGAHAQQK